MSDFTERAKPETAVVVMVAEICFTASNESGLAAGKPASIEEIPHFSSCLAMATFSLIEKLTPGVCSPSRRLVSRNSTLRIDNPLSKNKNDSSKKTSHSETQARCF